MNYFEEINLLLIGAGIGLLSSIIGSLLQHFLEIQRYRRQSKDQFEMFERQLTQQRSEQKTQLDILEKNFIHEKEMFMLQFSQSESKALREKLTQGVHSLDNLKCPSCNTVHPYNATFCSTCGMALVSREQARATTKLSQGAKLLLDEDNQNSSQKLETAEKDSSCSQCGFSNIPGAAFCDNCGKPLNL